MADPQPPGDYHRLNSIPGIAPLRHRPRRDRQIARRRSAIYRRSRALSHWNFRYCGYNNYMKRFNRLFSGDPDAAGGCSAAAGLPGSAWGAEPVTVWAGAPTEKAVALTFDDGPSPTYHPPNHGLAQTVPGPRHLFCHGAQGGANPRLVQALLKDGNEVGNHSFSHPRMTKEGQISRERELERTSMDLDLLGCPQSQQIVPAALQRL